LVEADHRDLVAARGAHEADHLVLGVREPEVTAAVAVERIELAAAGRGLHAELFRRAIRTAPADQPQPARDPPVGLVADPRRERLVVRRRAGFVAEVEPPDLIDAERG